MHHHVVVIGAGFTGLDVGIELRRRGIEDFVLLERRGDVGGVWHDNTYPGVAVDTPSKIYQLARAPHPEWSEVFAPGNELQAYTRKVAEDFDLMRHVRLHHAVEEARWDDDACLWRIATSQGDYTADILVSAAGLVNDPLVPDIPGLADFPGTVWHSSQWCHDHDLTGERVAVVGTGASAIQFIPRIQPIVGELHVLQRTPTWISPRPAVPIDDATKEKLRSNPQLMRRERRRYYWLVEYMGFARHNERIRNKRVQIAKAHLEAQVTDPELRAKLTPDFGWGCKRPLLSSDYYPALQQPNATLHTGGLVEVRGRTVVAGDGTKAEVDTIILNTGFEIGRSTPIARRIVGRGGRTLADYWGRRSHAYKGMAIPGYPNFFLMQGPNATSGVSSALLFADAQARYIANAVRMFDRRGATTVEIPAGREARYTKRVRRRSSKTVYETGGCVSYYLNDDGENVVMWPGFTFTYQLKTWFFDAWAYRWSRRAPTRSTERPAAVPAAAR